MAGYNFTYLIYAKFEKPVDGVFLKQLTTEFLEKLDEDLREWIGVDYEEEKGFASFSLQSLTSLDYDTMYEAFDNFEDHLKFKQAHFVGAIHSFDRTTDDYQNYDDVMYTEFVPTSEEEKNKLKQLLIKEGTLYVTGDCVLALRNGHIDELDDDAANSCINTLGNCEVPVNTSCLSLKTSDSPSNYNHLSRKISADDLNFLGEELYKGNH